MWPLFGGNPLRFSLVEFGEVTGLPCGEFEEGYSIDYQVPGVTCEVDGIVGRSHWCFLQEAATTDGEDLRVPFGFATCCIPGDTAVAETDGWRR